MPHRVLITAGLLLGTAALVPPRAAAQQSRLHFDVSALEARASEVNDVTLDGAVLKLGMAFLNDDNSGLDQSERDMLSKLQGVYVKNLEFKHGAAPPLTDAVLAPVRAQLKGPCWSRIVSSHSTRRDHGDASDETDEVYVCTGAHGAVEGLAVLSRQPDELDFVNIVGSIDPAELSKLGGHLGIPKFAAPSDKKGRGQD